MLIFTQKLIIIFICLTIRNVMSNHCASMDDFDNAQLIITLSAKIDGNLTRKIGIYWYNKHFMPGDSVAIYDKNPVFNNLIPVFKYTPDIHSGNVITPLTLSFVHGNKMPVNKDVCLKYYGAWVRNNKVRKMICLSTHRNWMYEMKNDIGPFRLNEVILPGSHKSGSFIKNLPKWETPYEKYTITQNQDILTQLVHGVRFIDLSPDYFPENSIEYWLNEACPQKTPLLRILMDVKLFLLATKEIIVMNFRSFSKGFKNDDDRRNFKKFLEKQFEDHILYERPVNPWNITLNEIWQSKKRLIITFDHAVQSENNSVWSLHINNELEHTKSIEVIRKVIDEEYDAKYYQVLCIHEPCIREPRVIMAAFKSNYIPDCYGISNNIDASRYQDPRSAADIISPIVLQMYNEHYFGTANIIELNFVDATGIVEFAIEWNKRRASPCYEYYKSLMAPSTIFYV